MTCSMRTVGRNDPCPCGTGLKFKKCCGPAVEGVAWPGTPEALMRSRYTAYVVGAVDHLYRTAHPTSDQIAGVDPEQFKKETGAYCQALTFTGLTIHQTWPADEQGVARVKFTAAYTLQNEPGAMTELSEFVRLNDRWVYLRGEET